MKKVICLFVLAAILLSFISCGTSEDEANRKREEFIMKYEKNLQMLGAVLSQSTIEDEKYSGSPWVTDRIQLPNSDTIVSLDILSDAIHVYELQTGNTLQLTAEEIADLFSLQNEAKQAEFEKLCNWYHNENGQTRKEYYGCFVAEAYVLYKNSKGTPFIDKAHSMYTSEEKYKLAKWALENIDYDYVEKVIKDPDADYVTKRYVLYLHGLGLIDENGKPVNTETNP